MSRDRRGFPFFSRPWFLRGALVLLQLFLAAAPAFPQDAPPRKEETAYWIAELESSSLKRRSEAFFQLQRLGSEARAELEDALEAADFQTRLSIRYLLDHEPVKQRMAAVPAGTYSVGSKKLALKNPQRDVALRSFLVDEYEVTNFMYYVFVRATGHPAPEGWSGGRYPLGRENLPVTAVTFEDAQAYARWAGKRLPTAEEWEVASGGADGRGFPWGDKADKDAANIDNYDTLDLAPVGSFERDLSPFGCRDMAGNAAEWVVSRDKNGRAVSARKGADFNTPFQYPVAYLAYGAIPLKDGDSYRWLGFRCVRDAPPGAK